MRNHFLGSLVLWLLAVAAAPAQAPGVAPEPDDFWQPPRTDLDERPNRVPRGFPFYGGVDYLVWWTEKDRPLTALTADPAAHPGNAVLGEGTDFDPLLRHGVRGVLGLWLDRQQTVAFEGGGLWLSNREPNWRGASGAVGVHTEAASRLWGAEANLRCELVRRTYCHLDFLGGFRHLSLDEALSVIERDPAADAVTSDRCGTRNRFYGGQLGLEMELHNGNWTLDIYGKAALGADCETVKLGGTALVGGQSVPGGLLVTPAASGARRQDEFAVVPEFGVHLSYTVTNNLRASVGYTFLYLSDAARPSEQLDALRQSPHSSILPIPSSDFWGQGLSVGLEFRF